MAFSRPIDVGTPSPPWCSGRRRELLDSGHPVRRKPLKWHGGVGLVPRDERVDNARYVSAGQIMRFEIVIRVGAASPGCGTTVVDESRGQDLDLNASRPRNEAERAPAKAKWVRTGIESNVQPSFCKPASGTSNLGSLRGSESSRAVRQQDGQSRSAGTRREVFRMRRLLRRSCRRSSSCRPP